MWKFMVFGVIVQTVIFMSLMDVNVYEREVRRSPHTIAKRCPKKLILFVIEGLQMEDLNETWESEGKLRDDIQNFIHRVVDTPASINVRPHQYNESVFGDRRIFYIGPKLELDHFSTDEWQKLIIRFPLINNSGNISEFNLFTMNSGNIPEPDTFSYESGNSMEFRNHSESFIELDLNMANNDSGNFSRAENYINSFELSNLSHSAAVSQIMRSMFAEIVKSVSISSYSHILVRFPNQDESGLRSNRNQRSYILMIESLINIPEFKDDKNIYVVSSSMETFSQNTSYPGPRNDSILFVWSKECRLPTVNTTLDYFRAFEWINYLVSKADPSHYHQEEKLTDVFPGFVIEGNLLEVFGFGQSEKRQVLAKARLNSLEALNVMLFSMSFMEIEYEAVAVAGTMLLIIPWGFLLYIKAWKMVVPTVKSEEKPNDMMSPHFLDSSCFAILAIFWILGNYWNWEFRYFLYYFVSVIIFRLFCEELTTLSYSTETLSLTNKLKIAFQILLFFGVVESLFWATTCGRVLYILFISVVAAKIFHGAFSPSNFRVIMSFAAAALSVGFIYLCPIFTLPYYVTINVTICIWMLGGFFAIKYMMDDSTHDRFLVFLCLIEFLMASIFANLYVFQNEVSLAIILSFFLMLSSTLPLLGSTDAKCRLLALSVTTASFFLFFSSRGEGLLLLALFITCFCSFVMDKTTSNVRMEGLKYFCIFPGLFYTVIIVAASEMITPIAYSRLFPSSVLTEIGVSYSFMTYGLAYIVKVFLLLTLFGGIALSSCKKTMEVPCFFLIIVILNLVSLRTFLQLTLVPKRLYSIGLFNMFLKHILMQTLATALFFLYPFIQLMTKESFFTLCLPMKNVVGLEPIKQS